MSAGPSNEEIKEALERSGYLMEQEVATQLEKLGYHVWTNAPFEDPDEGKSREMDVRAVQRVVYDEEHKISAFIEIVAECKNSDNPYVFIKRPKNSSDNNYEPLEWQFPLSHYEMKKKLDESRLQVRSRPAFFHLGFDTIKYDSVSEDKAVQFCKIDRTSQKKWTANHGGLYDAIFFPMAKAVMSRKNAAPKGGTGPEEWRYFWFIFPIVVLSGRILVVDSVSDDKEPLDVKFINFRRDLKSKSLDGRFSVDFVRQANLDEYHETCITPVMEYTIRLMADEVEKVMTKEIPWEEGG